MGIVGIAVYIVLILIGLGLLSMLVFGIRSAAYGKINPITLVIIVLPIILLGVLGLVMDDWSLAGIWTFIIMLIAATVALLVTGLKGLFN